MKKYNLKNMILTGIAGLSILASPLYTFSQEKKSYFNENHRKWEESVIKTEEMRQKDKNNFGELEFKIFRSAEEDDGSESEQTSEYSKFNASFLEDIIRTCGFYAQNVPMFSEGLRLNYTKNDDLKKFISESTDVLLSNTNYVNVFKTKLDTGDIDCKAYSFTAAAIAVKAMKQETNSPKSVEIVTGMIFHKKASPEGAGHQWVKLGDEIIDEAIKDDVEKHYIPIAGVNIKYVDSKGKFLLSPKVYSLPEKLRK